MVLKMSTFAITFLATFRVADFARIGQGKGMEREQLEKQAQIEARDDEEDANMSVVEDKIGKAFEDGPISASDDTDASSAGAKVLEFPAALVQHAVSQGSIFPSAFKPFVRKRLGAVPNEPPRNRREVKSARDPPSIFSKTLEYVENAGDHSRITILKAACDSSAFSCKEIIKLANNSGIILVWDPPGTEAGLPLGPSKRWLDAVKLFAEGRNNTGCISDPANVGSIVDLFEAMWPALSYLPAISNVLNNRLAALKKVFIANQGLKPARGIEPSLVQLKTGLRTDQDMQKLLGDLGKLQLIKAYGSQEPTGEYEPGSASVQEFESWLKQIRAQGEQFSGPQLVTLVDSIPRAPVRGPGRNSGTAQAVSVLLQSLEQYVTGVTCEEAKQIMHRMDQGGFLLEDLDEDLDIFLLGLDALKSNIVDGENKVDIVAFTDGMNYNTYYPIVAKTEQLLHDVGVGLPPKNNPVFGVVSGNPVIFVVDGSNSMDAKFTLGGDIVTRRKFCHSQLETVLEGLPKGTYFNVIHYSSSAVKVFQKTVLASKTNINRAMEAVSGTYRGDHRPGQDPAEMLRNIQAFALNFKYQLDRSAEKKSMEALQLAYATADSPWHRTGDEQHTPRQNGELVETEDSPQIHFLTSGEPDGGARQILDKIDEFDSGRDILVNSIAFIMPADLLAKQFVKDLANKTGGFFRSIEQPLVGTNKRKREPTENQGAGANKRKREQTL